MTVRPRFLLIASLLALGACATPSAPIEVTRFHLGEVNERGTVAIEAADGKPFNMEYDLYAKAISDELTRLGYAPVAGVDQSLYVAIIDVRTAVRERPRGNSGVSIGLGGGTGGWSGGGVGGGVSFNLGGSRDKAVVGTQLSVQLKRRSDQTVVWEGRARGEASERDYSGLLVQRLAAALFRDFPGQSGRTISVP